MDEAGDVCREWRLGKRLRKKCRDAGPKEGTERDREREGEGGGRRVGGRAEERRGKEGEGRQRERERQSLAWNSSATHVHKLVVCKNLGVGTADSEQV